MVTLENDYLSVKINPLGAELTSLYDKEDSTEHMWSADPEFWPRRAPILFPCVGESYEGKVRIDGIEYPMGRHGFARHQEFRALEITKSQVMFELSENTDTLKNYPFQFKFRVRFLLEGRVLHHQFEVENTGNGPLGFQLGGHPAFTVPFKPHESYADYMIQFDKPITVERHLLNENGLYNGEKRQVLSNDDTIPLSYELFKEDALVFKDISFKAGLDSA